MRLPDLDDCLVRSNFWFLNRWTPIGRRSVRFRTFAARSSSFLTLKLLYRGYIGPRNQGSGAKS
jgi:hypothetical protein